MQTVIYFVRHGKVHNPKNILYGRIAKFGLAEETFTSVVKTANYLLNKKINAIYSSPLLRAKQTAGIIQKVLHKDKLFISEYINEVKSSLEGKSRNELRKINFDFYSEKHRKPGDETIRDIEKRMFIFIYKIAKIHQGKSVVAVSHADPIMIIHAGILNLPLTLTSIREPERNYIKFGEVFKIEILSDKKMKLRRVFSPI